MSKQAPKPARLTATFCRMVTRPDRYGDGRGSAGLALLVTRTTAGHLTKRWIQRVRIHGQANNIALGRLPAVSLREARVLALVNADTAAAGRDPRQPSTLTFEQAAEVVIGLSMGTWKDPERIAGQWAGTLRAYAYPVNRPDGRVGRYQRACSGRPSAYLGVQTGNGNAAARAHPCDLGLGHSSRLSQR